MPRKNVLHLDEVLNGLERGRGHVERLLARAGSRDTAPVRDLHRSAAPAAVRSVRAGVPRPAAAGPRLMTERAARDVLGEVVADGARLMFLVHAQLGAPITRATVECRLVLPGGQPLIVRRSVTREGMRDAPRARRYLQGRLARLPAAVAAVRSLHASRSMAVPSARPPGARGLAAHHHGPAVGATAGAAARPRILPPPTPGSRAMQEAERALERERAAAAFVITSWATAAALIAFGQPAAGVGAGLGGLKATLEFINAALDFERAIDEVRRENDAGSPRSEADGEPGSDEWDIFENENEDEDSRTAEATPAQVDEVNVDGDPEDDDARHGGIYGAHEPLPIVMTDSDETPAEDSV